MTAQWTPRLRQVARTGRTIGAFGLVPVLGVVTPLVVIPVISRTAGPAGIVATAVGQSVGAVAGIAVALGWPLLGPALVARSREPELREATYTESIRGRLRVLAVLGPLSFLVAYLLVGELGLVAGLSGLAFAGYGLTAAWYYAGTGDARGMVVADTLPRVGATVLAGGALALGAPLAVYPMLLIAAVGLSQVLNSRRILGSWRLPLHGPAPDLRGQLPACGARLLHGLYSMGSVSIVAALSPAAAFPFTAYNRIQKPALGATAAFSQALVSWIGGGVDLRARMRVALAADLAFSVLLGTVVYLALPLLLRVLFGDLLVLDPALGLATAAVVATGTMARCLQQHGLLMLGDQRFTTRLLAIQSAASVAVLVAVVVPFGALGATVAVAAGEGGFCLLAAVRIAVVWRRDR
jgi:PST family polysaccharide transporter